MTNRTTALLRALAIAGALAVLPIPGVAQDGTAPTDLAAAFPDTIGGAPLVAEVLEGPAWLERQGSSSDAQAVTDRTQSLVSAAGKTIEDLSIGTALHEPSEGNRATLTAVQVDGASSRSLVRPTIALLLGDLTEPVVRVVRIDGRDVLRVSDGALPGTYPRTIYPQGDTVWVTDAEGPLLLEMVAALPAAPPEPRADPAVDFVAAMPFEVGGDRRSQLQVYSGWGSLLNTTPDEMFGPQFADAEQRLFLDDGITVEDLSSAVGIWDSLASGLLVVGFRIDGADAELMKSVRDAVIVPAMSLSSQQPSVEQRQVAGRDVVTVSDQGTDETGVAPVAYHFIVSGDTIWMINLTGPDDAALASTLEQLPA